MTIPVFAQAGGREPFVAFVGAGASALPPSSLPTWISFNDLLLEALCRRLAAYSRNRQPTLEMLALFRARRDRTRFFAPDFQAQLMEEEIGADYFRVWQSLQTDRYGPVHAALAGLAQRGRLAAIITTNFDGLLEKALRDRGHAFEVFHDRARFDRLAQAGGRPPGARLPVIKIHGSLEDPDSLVDTLRQRLAGTPASLLKVLQQLLQAHPWLYLGFSGEDFSYNPHYLGILDAAESAKGFVFLARAGHPLKDGVRLLQDRYGAAKASVVEGDLSTWLQETFGLPAWAPAGAGACASEPAAGVAQRIGEWVERLGPMAVVNMLYSMLKSSGMEQQALWLLRKTWKSYRSPDDLQSPSYARYNYNYGLSLLDAGFISNPVALAEDKSNLLEWKSHADQNAYEFLARSHATGKLITGAAQVASVLAYRGEVGRAIALAAQATDEALEKDLKLELCDIAIASVTVYDIVRLFSPAVVGQLAKCRALAIELGDEPRRAVLCAHLGRFLTYAGRFAEADAFITESAAIADRLDLQATRLASQAVRGRWLTDGGTSDSDAVRTLRQVAETLREQDETPLFTRIDLAVANAEPEVVRGRNPALCRVLLDLNRAARCAGDAATINQTLDWLDELAPVFPGYCPHYYLAYAECLLEGGEPGARELIADLIARARAIGSAGRNPWVAQAADALDATIASR